MQKVVSCSVDLFLFFIYACISACQVKPAQLQNIWFFLFFWCWSFPLIMRWCLQLPCGCSSRAGLSGMVLCCFITRWKTGTKIAAWGNWVGLWHHHEETWRVPKSCKVGPIFLFFFFFWQWLFKRVSYHLMICYWLIPMSSSHYAAYRKLQPFGLSRTPGFGGLHIYILVWVWFKQTNSWLNLSINSWMQVKMFGLFSPRVFRLERQWLSASLESVSTRLAFRHVLLFAEVLFSKHSRSDVQELLFLTKTWMSLIAIWYFFFKVVTI